LSVEPTSDAPADKPPAPARKSSLVAWISVAVFAAAAAGAWETMLVERARNRLLRDQGDLQAAALKATQNQLEAERIVVAREHQQALMARAAGAGMTVVILTPPPGSAALRPSPLGVMVWDAVSRTGILRVSDLPAGAGNLLALWAVAPDGKHALCCGVFPCPSGDDPPPVRLETSSALWPGSQYLLFRGYTGLGDTLAGAREQGSIVLATPPSKKAISTR